MLQPALNSLPVPKTDRPGHSWLQISDSDMSRLLMSGGDERIAIVPDEGKCGYGVSFVPMPDHLCFGSATANTVTLQGFGAARRAVRHLISDDPGVRMGKEEFFDGLRARILGLYGIPGAEAVLTASGTEGELVALAIAHRLLGGKLTNIVIAPDETGSGVAMAAAGGHFLGSSSMGGPVPQGERLAGWHDSDIVMETVPIRDEHGEPRDAADIAADAHAIARAALDGGRQVLLHRLETSKTGLRGLSRTAAAEIVALAPNRVLVMVDACQLRSPREGLWADAKAGFMTLVTGSKFAGGPPFCGALILPPAIADRLETAEPAIPGLAAYSAWMDWPERFRRFARTLEAPANIGAGLRWEAALSELERFEAVEPARRESILARFEQAVRARASELPFLSPAPEVVPASLVPVTVLDADGAPAPSAAVRDQHIALRSRITASGPLSRIVHLGQPVTAGPRTVLRVCASAAHVTGVAARMTDGRSIEAAFAPLEADISAIFEKWAALV